jgi:hypothetical protein
MVTLGHRHGSRIASRATAALHTGTAFARWPLAWHGGSYDGTIQIRDLATTESLLTFTVRTSGRDRFSATARRRSPPGPTTICGL